MKKQILLFVTMITWLIFIVTLFQSSIDPLYQGYVCMGGTFVIFGMATLLTRLFFTTKES